MRDCPHCGTAVTDESRFCPECGRPLTEEAGATAIRSVHRRWPPDPLVIVVLLVAIGGLILLVGRVWAWGLAVLLAAGVLFLFQREAERARALHQLGHAVFYKDKEGTKSARAAVEAVVERISEKEAEIETLIRQTGERVERAQAAVRPTERIQAEQPPEPARIPEPWPPPDEGSPPAPVPVPEPTDPPPEPEHPPMPQSKGRRKA